MFLSADAIMTMTVFAVFVYLRFTAPQWPAAFNFGSGLMSAAMTMFLLCGSFTIRLAVRADANTAGRWIAVTIASAIARATRCKQTAPDRENFFCIPRYLPLLATCKTWLSHDAMRMNRCWQPTRATF